MSLPIDNLPPNPVVSTTDTKEQKKLEIMKLLEHHGLEIESLNQRLNMIQQQIESLPATIQNVVVQTIQGLQQTAQQAGPPSNEAAKAYLNLSGEEKTAIFSKLIEKGMDKIFGSEQQTTSIIDDTWLKQQLAETVKEQIMLGHEVTQAVRKTLTGAKARNSMLSVIDKHELE